MVITVSDKIILGEHTVGCVCKCWGLTKVQTGDKKGGADVNSMAFWKPPVLQWQFQIGLCQSRGFVVCDVTAAPFSRYSQRVVGEH